MKISNCLACGSIFKGMSGYVTQLYCSDKCNFLNNFKEGNPEDCWEWQGRKDTKGYGGFGRDWVAYRYSYEYYKGPRTKGLLIRHLCNNPGCVNPNHLKEGTYQDNRDDLTATGYKPKVQGEDNALHKLFNEEALEIFNSKEDSEVMAEKFNISNARVNDIRAGRGWNHITGMPLFVPTKAYKPRQPKIERPKVENPSQGMNNPAAILTDAQVLEIYSSTDGTYSLARKYDISDSAICDIKYGRTWLHVTGATPYDGIARYSGVKGEKHHNNKLTSESVIAIYESKERNKDLVKKYNVKPATISDIKHGRIWNHLTNHKKDCRKEKLND